MITDEEKSLILNQYYDRGILKKEIRSYEVSLWTLQDRFITVLKWSDVEQKGRIENPKMTLNIDGTSTFKFSVPMYYRIYNHPDYEYSKAGELIENPNWSTIQEPNVIKGLRKIKVIFNKSTPEQSVFEFIITNVLENHESDVLTCEVECEGLAFQELGKIGYKINLSMDNFELVYADWLEHGYWTKPDGSISQEEPLQTVDYWCEEAGLVKLPIDSSHISSRTWYYDVRMSWTSMQDGASRATDKVYEEPYVSSWDNELYPLKVASYTEKARTVSIENSNLYNITQTIAEQFQIYCRYEYLYDDNYNIIGRVIVFYNNFFEENKPALSLQYPYSARQTERTINSADVTTKLYVLSVDNDVTLDGANTIMNAPANGSREDYILNFDYMYKIGAIDKDQYDAIKPYEVQMRRYNDELIDAQQRLTTLQKKETELAAKRTVAANSVDLDNEQILQNSALCNALDATDKEGDGYVTLTAGNADFLVLLNDETDRNYVNLKNTNKGIKEDSIAIYKTLSTVTNSGATLSDQITHFSLEKDSYNNLTSITFTVPSELMKNDEKVGHVYLTYKYKPELYYDNVIKIWKIKMAQDNDAKNEYTRELGPKSATESGYDLSPYPYGTTVEMAYNQGIYKKINDCINTIDDLQREKKRAITAFERLMGPALREGYWQPDNYSDYGDHKNYQSLITQDDLTIDTDTGAVIAWDSTLFDEEDKLYYQIGIDQATEYYPCIDLSGVFSNNIPSNLNEYSVVWKATAYGNYDWNDIQHLGVAAVGSKAMIRFIKINDAIKPVLVIESAKNFSAAELERLIVSGSARLELYSTTVDNSGSITVSHGQTQYSIGNNWLCFTASYSKPTDWTDDLWNKYTYLSDRTIRPMVYPRIKISSLALKTDTINLNIKYNNNLLDAFADYYINTRDTERNSTYFLEYYITIKPEVLIKFGLNQLVDINYVISNANTAIYLDALKVSKENAKPKVSYNVGVTLLNLDLTKTLYNKLAQIVMINDAQLKLEDAFGYISGLELDLDAPQNDSVEVQNYTTKFEDLFSTIVAQTEEMKRMGNRMSATVNGNTGLSSAGIENTLTQNEIMLAAYLDSHFDSSEVVRQKLRDLFTEAGEILANSNSALNKISSLTEKNASILSGFATNVAQELSVSVFESANKPTSFKPGDIWIDNEGNHYVATGSSATSGTGGTAGFVRTYDGTLASMEGAALNVNADDGEITIKAVNNVSVSAADVNIVGNKSVNIGGTTINIGSTSTLTEDWGGINLVASSYSDVKGSTQSTTLSKVLISPQRIELGSSDIYMRGANKIQMVTSRGTSADTSAIEISPDTGVWIGSGQGVRLFSGGFSYNATTNTLTKTAAAGASVELNSEHLIMGYANTQNNTANAIEISSDFLIIAAGSEITGTQLTDSNKVVTGDNSGLIGARFTKDSIGFATSNNNVVNAILMNDLGISLGSGIANLPSGVTLATATNTQLRSSNGSYVRIAPSGIELGSTSELYVNMNNFKLQTDSTYGTRFAVGYNLQYITSNSQVSGEIANSAPALGDINYPWVGLVFTNNNLYIQGTVYASAGSFTGDVTANKFIATCTNGKFKADGSSLGFYTTNDAAVMTFSSTTMTVASGYTLSIGGNFDISSSNLTIKSNPGQGENYFYVGESGASPTKYIKYTQSGTLEVKGSIVATSFSLSSSSDYTQTKSWVINTTSTAYTPSTDSGITWTAWSSSSPDLANNKGKYLHTKISTTLGGQTTITYDVNYIGQDGADGEDGEDGTSFDVDGISSVTWNGNTYVSLTQASEELAGVLVGYSDNFNSNTAIRHFIVPRSTTETAVDICRNYINFDYNASNYIHMNSGGIDVSGNRIRINGREVWARDDIVVMNSNASGEDAWRQTVSSIEDHMSGQHDWVLIRPYYNAQIPFTSGGVNKNISTLNEMTLSRTSEEAFGDSANGYSYTLEVTVKRTQTGTQPSLYFRIYATNGTITRTIHPDNGFTASNGVDRYTGSGNNYDYTILRTETNLIEKEDDYGNTPGLWTFRATFTANSGASHNLAGEGFTMYMNLGGTIYQSGNAYAQNVTVTANCDASTSRVPCTVYYYP